MHSIASPRIAAVGSSPSRGGSLRDEWICHERSEILRIDGSRVKVNLGTVSREFDVTYTMETPDDGLADDLRRTATR
jgi:hypothetical protein